MGLFGWDVQDGESAVLLLEAIYSLILHFFGDLFYVSYSARCKASKDDKPEYLQGFHRLVRCSTCEPVIKEQGRKA